MRRLWFSTLGLEYKTNQFIDLCSDHFSSTDFVLKPSGIPKELAVPQSDIIQNIIEDELMSHVIPKEILHNTLKYCRFSKN